MKKMLYRRSWLGPMIVGGLAALVVLVVLSGLTEHVSAQRVTQTAENTQCSNLDVVFIVDQSQSMSILPQANDPTEQRKNAVIGMIDLLMDSTLDECRGSYHRIAVISFGTTIHLDLDLTDIHPVDSIEARLLRDSLRSAIEDAYEEAHDLGGTYPEAAFIKAAYILDNAPSVGQGIRKRAVIFVTDGFPCVPGTDCIYHPDYLAGALSLRDRVKTLFTFDGALWGREKCLSPLYSPEGEIIDEVAATKCKEDNPVEDAAYETSTYIWTILLNNREGGFYTTRAQTELAAMTEEYAGQLIRLLSNREDVPTTMRRILSQLIGVQSIIINCGNFAVNPYLRRMVITAYKVSVEVNTILSYTDANGVRHEITAGQATATDGFDLEEYYPFGTNERYDFNYPYPGIWQLSSSNCTGLDVYYNVVEIDPQGYSPNLQQELQYDISPYCDPDDPQYLEYQMRNIENRVIPQADLGIFEVDVHLVITDPTGKQVTYPMKWVPEHEQRLFKTEQPIQLPASGTYKINIEGVTNIHEGEPGIPREQENLSEIFNTPYTVFSHENVEFSVLPVTGFVILSVSPQAGQTLGPIHETILGGLPLKVRPFPVRVRITDRQGQIMTDLDDIFSNSGQAFTVTLSSGSRSSNTVVLRPDPNIPGEFIGEITNFDQEGPQTLTIQVQDAAINEKYRPDSRRVEVPFTRVDCLFCRATTYYALFGTVLFGIFVSIIYNIAIRTNKVNGTLVFKDGATLIDKFGLYNGKNFRNIGARELKSYPQLMLKHIKVENAGKRKKGKSEAEDAVTGEFFTGQDQPLGVRVHLVTKGGRKFSMDLEPHLPTLYGELAQMIYEPVE